MNSPFGFARCLEVCWPFFVEGGVHTPWAFDLRPCAPLVFADSGFCPLRQDPCLHAPFEKLTKECKSFMDFAPFVFGGFMRCCSCGISCRCVYGRVCSQSLLCSPGSGMGVFLSRRREGRRIGRTSSSPRRFSRPRPHFWSSRMYDSVWHYLLRRFRHSAGIAINSSFRLCF